MRVGTKWLIACGAAVVLAGTVAAVVLTLPVGTEPPPCQPSGPGAPSGLLAGRSGITVVEQGFSVLPGRYPRVSIGAVLQNTSAQTARLTQVSFEALDEGGRPVFSGSRLSHVLFEVPLIPPGGRIAVGNLVYADAGARVHRVSITTAVVEWLPPGNASNGLLPITAAVVAGSGSRSDDGSSAIGFTTTSANCADLFSWGVAMVWRDPVGKILGGIVTGSPESPQCRAGGSGERLSVGTLDGVTPVGIDFDRTEITPFCDPWSPPRGGIPIAPFSPFD